MVTPSLFAGRAPELPKASALSREFEFLPADFERVRKLIYQRAGISLSEMKQDMVYSRLARRLRMTRATSFAQYLDGLERGNGAEWQEFINALTTNLTSFFRETHHFPLLAERIRDQGNRPLKIWCCAASTGEEPYSIAMTVVETLGNYPSQIAITASDIDTGVLATAQAGVYAADRVDRLAPERLTRFFTGADGERGRMYTVRPELRRMVDFRRISLLDANWPPGGPYDVIFCRNVMIYFDKPTQYKVLAHFTKVMPPDGLLFAGHSESFAHAVDLFLPRGKTVYERVLK